MEAEPNITLVRKAIADLDDPALEGFERVVISAGPLASESLSASIARAGGAENLYFYAAIAPIVAADSIDMGIAFWGSRYGEPGEGDYLNCPMNEDEYKAFYQGLLDGEKVASREFEQEKHFEGCMPVEALAARGEKTLAFGPLKPVGFTDPRTGRRPFALLQLRPENGNKTMFNLVGCQTKLTYPAQAVCFRKVPGLEHAEFVRFGSMHRNTYVNAPVSLNEELALKSRPNVHLAGQITGVEGYVESTASGFLAAVELARKAGAFVFGICNVVGSSIARATDSGAYIHVGPEIGVASTKAFTGQVTVMAMLALAVGREKGTVTEEYYREVAKGLLELPAVLEDVLGLGDRIADLSKIFTYAHNFIYLGRGYNYPTALEGALKLKEISYIHAEGYPAAEMKHGAIALIDNEMPTVAIATPDNTYEKTASNIEEIRARGGKIIAVIARDDTHVRRSADYTIEVPVVTDCLMPIVVSVPLQLLAYYIAVNKGRNVDQPRNLAKSVTVE